VPWVTYINVPETLFFFERSGRSGGEPTLAKAPVPIYPLLEMDASSGGAGKFIIKNRTKAKAIEALLKLVEEKSEEKKLQAVINYTDNPEEAEKLKEKLLSQRLKGYPAIYGYSLSGNKAGSVASQKSYQFSYILWNTKALERNH